MCVHISIEVLAASAIIGIIKYTSERFISFGKLEEYGVSVAKKLKSENETVYWIYTPEQVDAFFADYSDLFKKVNENGTEGIRLEDNVTDKDLIQKFQMHLTLKLERALTDPMVLAVLTKAA
jgi:hypothetical protein